MTVPHIRFDTSPHHPAYGWARIYGPVRWTFRCNWPHTTPSLLDANGRVERTWSDPLEALLWLCTEARLYHWAGWISYDLGRCFERLPAIALDDARLPLFVFTAHEHIEPVPALAYAPTPPPAPASKPRSTFDRPAYEAAVARTIEYIAAGDVFQVNLSQRFSVPTAAGAIDIYRRLLAVSPAAYGACLVFDDHAIVSNSPELFLHVTPDRRVVTRPIKGTRPRLPGMDAELRDSAKDRAELAMIVDLERNDLGRVCEVGSVSVLEARAIEAHPTVYHGVATVGGRLRKDMTFVDLLRATFPCGSVTGAPKIRAMEIIDELEPVRRGPYCGAVGHLDPDGTAQFNVAIRTMVVRDGIAHVAVGGGIVADSEPSDEYAETLVKARAMFAALGVRESDGGITAG
jgi:aminodeoxychorismate synthase component I